MGRPQWAALKASPAARRSNGVTGTLEWNGAEAGNGEEGHARKKVNLAKDTGKVDTAPWETQPWGGGKSLCGPPGD